jgi:DNA-binding transcriptional LysR family regulator
MDRFDALRTLIAAVDGGSLSAAARSLGMPLPTVSRKISELEAHLGTQLLMRTSRKLLLTDAGAGFVAASRRVMAELEEAERSASGEYRAPRGDLLITAPINFGKLHILPIVLEFLNAYPEVNVRLVLVDHVIDLIDNHVDVAAHWAVARQQSRRIAGGGDPMDQLRELRISGAQRHARHAA